MTRLVERFLGLFEHAPKRTQQELAADAQRRVETIVDTHIDALSLLYLQHVTVDSFGIERLDKFAKELRFFLKSLVMPTIPDDERRAAATLQIDFGPVIMERVRAAVKRRKDAFVEYAEEPSKPGRAGAGADVGVDALSGVQFEKLCAEVLARGGWACSFTPGSGDQGADIIARRGGVIAILQCKRSSKPVGNKAVQEALAAKAHYRAQHAAVVSNAAYTPSARTLATSAGVVLLHHTELKDFDRRLGR